MLYSTYRPLNFKEVVGQDNNLITLKEQVKQKKYDSAYLFAGHRGTGKTTIARILARAINCKNASTDGPCNECDSCASMLKNATLDFVELDAASHNSINDIKELVSSTKYLPTTLKKKIYIIDEVHNLSTSAFDALLKTIEEPPEHCIFILCTTELHKIPATIRSRCSIYQFNAISIEIMHDRLVHVLNDIKKPYEDTAINMIAKQADGSMRDALSIAEKIIISCDKLTTEHVKKSLCLLDDELSLKIIKAICEENGKDTINLIHKSYEEGKNLSHLADNLLETLTDAVLLIATQGKAEIYNSGQYKEELFAIVKEKPLDLIFWYVDQISTLREKIRNSLNPYMETQVYLIRCANPKLLNESMRDVLRRINELEGKVKNMEQGNFVIKDNKSDSKETTFIVSDEVEDDFVSVEEQWEDVEKITDLPFEEDDNKQKEVEEVEDKASSKNDSAEQVDEEDDEEMSAEMLELFSGYL